MIACSQKVFQQISTRVGNISAAKIHALLKAPVLKIQASVCEQLQEVVR